MSESSTVAHNYLGCCKCNRRKRERQQIREVRFHIHDTNAKAHIQGEEQVDVQNRKYEQF
jgi:hypothetical protein